MFSVIRRRVLASLYPKTLINEVFSLYPTNGPFINEKVFFLKSLRFRHSPRILTEAPPGSKYAPSVPLEAAEESIKSTLKNTNSMTDVEWDEFKADLLEAEDFISEETFSSIVMNVLLANNHLDLAHSFINYVENSTVKPNYLTYLKYMSLCSKNHRAVDQNIILRVLNKVKKQLDSSPVIDLKRAEYLIQGLCATDRWKESLQYLDKLIATKRSREICNSLACAAIRNNDEQFAWEVLKKWSNSYDTVSDSVIEEFLFVALEKQKHNSRESEEYLLKILKFMQERDVIVSLDVAKLFERYFSRHRLKWEITYTKISRKGVCGKCSEALKTFDLTDKELEDLRGKFLQRCVMKSDIHYNTNQRELTNYLKFIENHKPFHIVLDGLNAAHSYLGQQSKKNLCAHLMRIVRKLAGNHRKVLVLGRKHMKIWPGIEKINDRAKLFFTDNISQDDPFVIYAALASGPHTLFLSDDLMRDHISRLEDPRIIHLFKRWQLSRQVFVRKNGTDYLNVKFVEPVAHSITVQGDMECGWHIPFDDKIILDPYEELNNWLCIKLIR